MKKTRYKKSRETVPLIFEYRHDYWTVIKIKLPLSTSYVCDQERLFEAKNYTQKSRDTVHLTRAALFRVGRTLYLSIVLEMFSDGIKA